MIKMRFSFLSLFATLLIPFSSTAQLSTTEKQDLLQKIDNALTDIKTLVYKIDHTKKFLSSRDTVHTTAVCSLYIAPKDKMKAYNLVDLEFAELGTSTYGHRRYDGKRTFWTNYLTDSLDIPVEPDIEKDKRMKRAIIENYSFLLLEEYLTQNKPFGKYQSAAEMIGINEENLENTPVYVLTIAFKDHDDVRDNVEKHYIRKSDFLPVAYSSFLRWENMEQYNYYEVDYLAINPGIPLEAFKIDERETINARKRYEALKRKVENLNVSGK